MDARTTVRLGRARQVAWQIAHTAGCIRRARVLALAPILALACLLAACQTGPNSNAWQALGPTDGSVILSLASDPHNPQLIYAGSSDGVVYRTLANKGAATQPGTGIPATAPVAALVPDERTAGTLYAGTRAGIYVSTDYGDTWKLRNAVFPVSDGVDALIAGTDASTLVAGSTQHGVAISHNAGQTWQPTNTGLPSGAQINALLRDASTDVLYAAVAHAGIFGSTDGGQSWTGHASGLPASAEVLTLAELSTHGLATTGPTLYAGTSAGLFASGDGGQQWSAVASDELTGHISALATDATHPGWLYAGTDTTVLRSEDGGRHWSTVASGIGQSVVALAVVPSSGSTPVVFAASGQLMRYPPFNGASGGPGNTVVSWILLGLLVALGIVVLFRSRSRAARTYGPRAAQRQNPQAQPGDGAPPTAPLNGHKPLDASQRTGLGGRPPRPNTGDGQGDGGSSTK